MNKLLRRIRNLSEDELDQLSLAITDELESRAERRIPRGFQHSTHLADRVRGRRQAPRYREAA